MGAAAKRMVFMFDSGTMAATGDGDWTFANLDWNAGDELLLFQTERGAGSAYRVNGRDVRAKDVALTFADAARTMHRCP